MSSQSFSLPSTLSDRPDQQHLEQTLARVLAERGDGIEFAVLFGSMARGNWSRGSDFDVLIGLRAADGLRFVDRLGDLDALVEGNVQLFAYDRPAWERMFESYHPLLLETLEYGIPLFDRGDFAAMRARFTRWRADGTVVPLQGGWRIPAATET